MISLIVKGISRTTPNLLLLSSPFCHAEFDYLKGNSDLWRFCDGAPLDSYPHLRSRLRSLEAAGEMAWALLHSQLPGKPAPLLYALFLRYLKEVETWDSPSPLVASFYLKLLKHEGLLSREDQEGFSTLVEARHFAELKELVVPSESMIKIKQTFIESVR